MVVEAFKRVGTEIFRQSIHEFSPMRDDIRVKCKLVVFLLLKPTFNPIIIATLASAIVTLTVAMPMPSAWPWLLLLLLLQTPLFPLKFAVVMITIEIVTTKT